MLKKWNAPRRVDWLRIKPTISGENFHVKKHLIMFFKLASVRQMLYA